jgi:predicted acyltransferase
MVLVNLQGSEESTFRLLAHAPWHGVTLADFVFPFFLLATGISSALAHEVGGSSAIPIGLRRAAALFAIGLLLGWLLRPTLDPTELRVTGVLQRISIVYLACVLACRLRPGSSLLPAAITLLLVLHGALLASAPPSGLASMAPGMGMAGWLDQVALPGRAHRGTWDPEGVLSTLSAVATGLIGVATQRWLIRSARAVPYLLGAGLVLVAGGLAMAGWMPLNKSLWTPSFALVTSGAGLATYACLRLASHRLMTRPLALLAALGRTALTLYVVHMLLIALLILRFRGSDLWTRSYALLGATRLDPAVVSLIYAGFAASLCIAVTMAMRNRGMLLRV